jgi:hypothetical protein
MITFSPRTRNGEARFAGRPRRHGLIVVPAIPEPGRDDEKAPLVVAKFYRAGVATVPAIRDRADQRLRRLGWPTQGWSRPVKALRRTSSQFMELTMTEHRNNRPYVSRRAALTGTALALGSAAAAAVGRPAAAQEKISVAIALYQGTPMGNDRCGLCANFQPPHDCKFVQGQISPTGWCQLFTPKA